MLACGHVHAQVERKVERKAEPSTERERKRTEAPLRAPAKVEQVVPRKAERRPPASAPSQTQQLQQQIQEKRELDQGKAKPKKADEIRVVQCEARPVCGGGYGKCNGVQQTYQAANLESHRRDIVRRCVSANNPDRCNCAPQCAAVAQCTIF
jgi:hypothetical protein